jgi:RimJ/RimL family protein N-acetyltransferase
MFDLQLRVQIRLGLASTLLLFRRRLDSGCADPTRLVMAERAAEFAAQDWRQELPILTTRLVALREPAAEDLASIVNLLAISDASRFGIDEPISQDSVDGFITKLRHERAAGVALTYGIVLVSTGILVGLIQVRQLDPVFEAAEWDMTLLPSVRGTGVFLDAARLVGSFMFKSLSTHRLEARVLVQNGRANGALRKLGAVQEGLLRRAVRRGGDYVDQVLWSVLKDDWTDQGASTSSRVH